LLQNPASMSKAMQQFWLLSELPHGSPVN